MIILAAVLPVQSEKLPVYEARRAVDAIRIDGRLDERSWSRAPRATGFRHIYDPARPPRFPVEAAIVWDDTNLYVAFSSVDPEPWGRMRNRDDRLWEEEVVEVFLDPDGDGQNYVELEVSPHNVVVDLLIERPKGDVNEARRWNIDGLRTAVSRDATGWIAEIAMPWTSLAAAGVTAAPKPGDEWRAGLYRIKRPGGAAKADQIAALVAESASANASRQSEIDRRLRELRSADEYLAWSLTRAERGFHDPEKFGYLRFLR